MQQQQQSTGSAIMTESNSMKSISLQVEDDPMCRICHNTGGRWREALARACWCKGSVGSVHKSCLETWLTVMNKHTCPICNFRFHFHYSMKPLWQKKSRLESVGEGSGVEIIENRPYSNGPGGNGQYTKKIYHIGSHLPGWLKAILPKAALRVEEEAWNAYPYTKMRTTCPFVEKFFVDVETYYYPDGGQQVMRQLRQELVVCDCPGESSLQEDCCW